MASFLRKSKLGINLKIYESKTQLDFAIISFLDNN